MRLVSIVSLVMGCCVLLLSSPAALAQEEAIQVDCASLVTHENRELGFSAVEHASCLQSNERECFVHTCRLCKQEENASTKHYKSCDGLSKATLVGSKGSSVVMLEAASASLTNDECASRVATGDKNVGISAICDSSCVSGGRGCFGTERCKYCRLSSTPQIASSAAITTVASTASANNGLATNEENKDLSAVPMIGVGAAAGFTLALAAIATKSSRARRVEDASVHTPSGHPQQQLQRADSILRIVGRDRIAQL